MFVPERAPSASLVTVAPTNKWEIVWLVYLVIAWWAIFFASCEAILCQPQEIRIKGGWKRHPVSNSHQVLPGWQQLHQQLFCYSGLEVGEGEICWTVFARKEETAPIGIYCNILGWAMNCYEQWAEQSKKVVLTKVAIKSTRFCQLPEMLKCWVVFKTSRTQHIRDV